MVHAGAAAAHKSCSRIEDAFGKGSGIITL